MNNASIAIKASCKANALLGGEGLGACSSIKFLNLKLTELDDFQHSWTSE